MRGSGTRATGHGETLRAAGRTRRRPSTASAPAGMLRVLRADSRILILQIQQLGDTLAAVAVVGAIHRRYPGASIDVLAGPMAAAVYERSPHVRRIHAVPPSATAVGGALAWARAIRAVRRERYDCVLACTNHVSLRHGLLAWLTGAPERIGFDRAGRGFFFTTRLAVQSDRSCYDENMDLARAVDGAATARGGGARELRVDGIDDHRVSALLTAHHVPDDRPLVVLHPGANWQSKTWYAERWGAVADALADEGYSPVFVGIEREAVLVEDVPAWHAAPGSLARGRDDGVGARGAARARRLVRRHRLGSPASGGRRRVSAGDDHERARRAGALANPRGARYRAAEQPALCRLLATHVFPSAMFGRHLDRGRARGMQCEGRQGDPDAHPLTQSGAMQW